MENLFGFFIPFWITAGSIGLLILVLIGAVESRNWFWSSAAFIGLLFFLEVQFGTLSFIRDNPATALMMTGFYLFFGLAWSIIKWTYRVMSLGKKYQKAITLVLKQNDFLSLQALDNPNVDSDQRRVIYEEILDGISDVDGHRNYGLKGKAWNKDKMKDHVSSLIPRAVNNKHLIGLWIMYWPFSLISSFVTDFLKDMGVRIARFFSNIYTGIDNMLTKWITKKIE